MMSWEVLQSRAVVGFTLADIVEGNIMEALVRLVSPGRLEEGTQRIL